jgi:hypothetical protein
MQKTFEQLNIQTGYLYTTDGKKFDISVIVNFPNDDDYESDEFPETNLIDFYFGTPNDSDTEYYTKQFIEKQNKLDKLLVKLYDLQSKNPDDTELNEYIKFVQSQIVKLH